MPVPNFILTNVSLNVMLMMNGITPQVTINVLMIVNVMVSELAKTVGVLV